MIFHIVNNRVGCEVGTETLVEVSKVPEGLDDGNREVPTAWLLSLFRSPGFNNRVFKKLLERMYNCKAIWNNVGESANFNNGTTMKILNEIWSPNPSSAFVFQWDFVKMLGAQVELLNKKIVSCFAQDEKPTRKAGLIKN